MDEGDRSTLGLLPGRQLLWLGSRSSCGSDRRILPHGADHLGKDEEDILLVDPGYPRYSKTEGYFQQAAEEGLVEIVKLNDDEANDGNEVE